MSLTSQWQIWQTNRKVSLTSQWQFLTVSKILEWGPLLTVIDRSMTVFDRGNLWPCVIDSSQWQEIYGHLSLTVINDKKIMDKAAKSVIDRGQWQKKVSLTGCILYMVVARLTPKKNKSALGVSCYTTKDPDSASPHWDACTCWKAFNIS